MPIKKHQIRRVVEAFFSEPWALEPAKLSQITELLDLRQAGDSYSLEEIQLRIAGRREPDYGDEEPYTVNEDGVAVIAAYGVMAPKLNMMSRISGGISTQELARVIEEAGADRRVKAIVLDVDSPGGNALGVAELAGVVRSVREMKTMVGVANHQAASGGYWLISQCSEVVASPSSMLGSIGVYSVHVDVSEAAREAGRKYTVLQAGKNKAAANPYEPLTPERKAVLQESVDDYYRLFVAEVAAGRGVSPETVEKNFGQGKSMLAQRAVEAGLADRIATLSQVVAELGAKVRAPAQGFSMGPRAQEFRTMDPELMKSLREAGLITAESTKGEALAAMNAWYAAKGKEIPMVDGKVDVEAVAGDLKAKSQGTGVSGQGSGVSHPVTPSPSHPVTPAPSPQLPNPAQTLDPKEAEKIKAEERTRIAEIRARGKLLQVSDETIEAAVEDSTSLSDFLLKATAEKAGKETAVPKIETGRAASDKFAAAAVDAICLRGGSAVEKPAEGTRELAYHSLLDLAKESFRVMGCRSAIGSPDDIAKAALGDMEARGQLGIFAADVPFQTPGDFPNILSAAANKILEAAPEYVDTTYQKWAYKKPAVPDFKPSTLVRYGEFGEFPQHVDGDDFEGSTLAEDYAWIQVDSYGDEFGLTPVMMVNDDLAAFLETLADKNAAHDQTLNRLCVNLLVGNVQCADGYTLFDDTNHGNDISDGGAPATGQLSAMRLKLRQQKGVGNRRKLKQTINLLLIPEDLETTTQQLLASTLSIQPTTESATPIFKGQVDWEVEPILAEASTTQYYGFANPQRARSIVYCHQRGFEKMKTRNYYNPKNNCRIWQFEGRFAAAINNYRGVVRNAGTGAS